MLILLYHILCRNLRVAFPQKIKPLKKNEMQVGYCGEQPQGTKMGNWEEWNGKAEKPSTSGTLSHWAPSVEPYRMWFQRQDIHPLTLTPNGQKFPLWLFPHSSSFTQVSENGRYSTVLQQRSPIKDRSYTCKLVLSGDRGKQLVAIVIAGVKRWMENQWDK